MANEKRLIDANELVRKINKLDVFYFTDETDVPIYGCQMVELGGVLAELDEATTVDAIPVAEIEAYLQARLDEWNALGDRKFEPANVWGYNFITACFDDLERRLTG